MQFSTIALTGLLALAASAYEVLTPTLNSTITKGDTISIEWTSVDTDAEIFSIYITNFATHHWPPTVLSLAENVPRDDGAIDIRIPGGLSADYGWQINFINGTNTYVIYAQSPVFELVGPDVADPTPTPVAPVPYPTATGYANHTVTVQTTATATLCKTVSTVVYATPIVWFVEPSKEAVCENPAKETVTVTVTEGGHGYPTGPGASYPTGPACSGEGCPAGPSGGEGHPTGPGASYPTGPACSGEGCPVPSGPEGYPGCTGAGCPAPTGPAGGEGYPTGPACSGEGCPTGGYAAPTGSGGIVKPTPGPEFTGAASSVRVGGVAAMIVGVAAFLL